MGVNHKSLPSRQTGFSLAEIMIGLAIGLLATLVIVQVMSAFEGQKRVTTGTADAQTNGSIALYNISREVAMAGYTLMPIANAALECTILTANGIFDPGNPNPTLLSPVIVTDDVADIVAPLGDSTGDTITIRYGDSLSGGIPNAITSIPSTIVGVTGMDMENNLGCQTSDATLIINGNACSLSSASSVPGIGALTSGIASAAQRTITLNNNTNAVKGANLACLGIWHEITYRVNGGNLERQDLSVSAAFVPVVAGIVNLQVQYGISALANSNPITSWVDATGIWAAPTITNRNRIKAVRIAIVARNSKFEDVNVTAGCSGTNIANPTGLCAWDGASFVAPTINLGTGADANWARYRYRVFETMIPLRNVIWARTTL